MIPQYILARKDVSDYIGTHFSYIPVLKFPEKLYPAFKQVVVICRKQENHWNKSREQLMQVGKGEREFSEHPA